MFKNYLNYQNINLDLLKNLFIFILPFLLVSGPFIPDLLISLMVIFFIINYKKYDYKKIFYSKYLIFLLLFWIYLIINSFFSTSILISLKSSLPYFRFIIFLFLIKFFLNNNLSLRILLTSFLILYIFLLLDGIIQLYTGTNLFGYNLDASKRISSIFNNELILGSFISKTFVIILFLIFFLDLKHKYFLFIITIIISGLLVYLSRERSALFVYVLSFIFSIFLIKKEFLVRIMLTIISLMLIIVISNFDPMQRLYFHSLSQIKETKGFYPSSRHFLHYDTSYRIFKEKLLLGGGIKSFRLLCDKEPFKNSDETMVSISEKLYSPTNGFVFLSDLHDVKDYKVNSLLIFNENNYNKFKSRLDDPIFVKKNIDSTVAPSKKIFVFKKDIQNNSYKKVFFKNYQYVKKGDLLLSTYEFKNGCSTHPHNIYFQILSEIGLVGFVFLLVFYFYILKSLTIKIYNYIKKDQISLDIPIYGLYFSLFFPLLTSGNFFNNYFSILLFLPFGFILICQQK
tara:strand:+ start:413 stop:1948 length:1536 start_codon:yes stop_codon:yes gene_type:complete